ncbi:hypothetical protein CTI12_AA185760 [Artemisia annua]|uniref:Transmembrane protein n=1 Tax=Artemisia annua TaxID=35608 RepID=A0A2U1P777_ARTAN|nr:hypothetical protein CTI12_AA185760 [Artemisia annua]
MENDKPPNDRDTIVDIGTSESEYEEERQTQNKRAKTVVRSVGKPFGFEGSEDAECSSNSHMTSVKSSDDDFEDIESVIHNKVGKNGEHTPLLGKPQLKEKRKKAPKPPRPRKGPLLDTADMQLVKEIAEQTMKRRARVERLKSLKRRRAAKSSPPQASSNMSIFAMVITVLFFIVIIYQGFSSGQSSSLSFDDSPKSSAAPSGGLISIRLGNNLESNSVQQIANPPRKLMPQKIYHTTSSIVEQNSDSDSRTSVE